jgi:hypothetical protein
MRFSEANKVSTTTIRPQDRIARVTFFLIGNRMDYDKKERSRLLRKTGLTLACVTFVFVLGHSQADRKNELGLLLGTTVTPELRTLTLAPDRLQIGSGITFQMAYARQLRSSRTFGLYFEVPTLAVPLQNITASTGAIPSNYDSFFVTPGVNVKLFPRGSRLAEVTPSSMRAASELMEATTVRGEQAEAPRSSAGVSTCDRRSRSYSIGFRLEVRDLYTSKPTYNVSTGGAFQHNVVFSGGLVLHF